jgi:hypothetical protein
VSTEHAAVVALSPEAAAAPLVVQLYSGGLDSYLLWRHWADATGLPPIALHVPVGQEYEGPDLLELERLTYWHDMRYPAHRLRLFRVPERMAMPWLGNLTQPDGHVPLRNLLLVLRAVLYLQQLLPTHRGPVVVLLGAVAGESSRDKSGKFLRATSRLVSFLLHRRVRVVAPLRWMTKRTAVLAHLRRHPQDADLLALPRSCYAAGRPCGACMACFRRWVALEGTPVAQDYASPPWRWWEAQAGAARWWEWGLAMARHCPPAEWLGVAWSNAEALAAVHRARQAAAQLTAGA